MIIGVTGSIGSGKTTVAKMFAKLGGELVDADALGHQVYKRDSPAYTEIVKTFGNDVMDDFGEIDRTILGDTVFSDPEKLRVLNQIMHPRIKDEIIKRIKNHEGDGTIIIDAALLIEADYLDRLDVLVVVVARKDVRFRRLTARGLEHDKILAIMETQMPQIKKVAMADYVIDNNKDLAETLLQVKTIWNELKKRGADKNDRPKDRDISRKFRSGDKWSPGHIGEGAQPF